ncbi:MAG: TCR/Tet family MFS transporter [Pseudomonadota bacterium]
MATDAAPASRNAALFVFVTVALDAMGIGIIVPVMPDLLQELSGLSIGEAAIWGGYLAFSYALMQFVFSPTIGNLSDRYGRRPILLISLATLSVDYIVMALAPTLWLLFVGRIIAGIAGATYSTATAFIADVTPKEQRAAAFGLVGAGFGVGFVFGPAIGGLAGEFGTRAPFIAASIVAFANFIYGWFVLPESLSPENRRPFDWRRANPLGGIRQIAKFPMVAWFILVSFLYSVSHYVYPSIWSFYTKEKFAWSNLEIGLSLAAVGIGFAIVQGWAIRYILRWLGEKMTAYVGFFMNFAGMVGIAMIVQGWMIYAIMPLIVLGDIVKPALTGLMSNRIPDDAQGELQGVIASAQAITVIISPVMLTQLFGAFTHPGGALPYFPGAPFVASAAIMALAVIPFVMGLRAGRTT